MQGVFYRQQTKRMADELGVCGYVQNEPDGSVTACFEGEAAKVDALVDWCRRGPTAAVVANLESRQMECVGYRRFEVRR